MGEYLNFDDQYIIGSEVLGQGGFGKVVKGLDVKNSHFIACKIVSKVQLKSNPKLMELFQSEIELQRQLDSPFIAKIYKVFNTQDFYMLIMEYCEGGDLERYMKKRGPIPEKEAIGFLMQILAGFREIHSKSIIHRDIKPANILIKGKTLKISDFGCARTAFLQSQELAQTKAGSPYYIAPEILERQDYGFEVDIFSLGVLMYKMLFNDYPFPFSQDENKMKLGMQKENFDYKKNGVLISPQMVDFLSKLLKYDRNKRMTWAQIYKHPIVAKNISNEYISTEIILAATKIDYQLYNDPKFSNQQFSAMKQQEIVKPTAVEENKPKPLGNSPFDTQKKNMQAEQQESRIIDVEVGIKQYVHKKNVYGGLTTVAQSFLQVQQDQPDYQIPAFLVQKKIKSISQQFQKDVNERKNIFNMKFFNDFVLTEYYELIQRVANEDAKSIDDYLNSTKREAQKAVQQLGIKEQSLLDEINSDNLTPQFNSLYVDTLNAYGQGMYKKFKNEKDPEKKRNLFYHISLLFEASCIDKAIQDNIDFDFQKHKLQLKNTSPDKFEFIIEQKIAEALS